jgi:hypothetical protein
MWNKFIKYLFPSNHERVRTTVRYAFPAFAGGLVFASLAALLSESSSYITLSLSPQQVQEQESFFITVSVTAHTPVNAVDITIDYPVGRMRVDGIDTGTSVITLWTKQPYAKDGKVYLSGGTFRKGFVGTHTIARIRATALASGQAHVTTDTATFIAGDGKGTEIEVADLGTEDARLSILTDNGSIVGTASVTIVTDVDGDGIVDLKDISVFMAAWFSKKSTFDFNGDGKMTFRDFSILLYDSFFK